jgi:hypothetical protein
MITFSSDTLSSLVEISFDGLTCQYGLKSVDSSSFTDCLIWASHEVPQDFQEKVLEAAISLDSKAEIISIFFSPEMFGLAIHIVQTILLGVLLHLFFSVVPER